MLTALTYRYDSTGLSFTFGATIKSKLDGEDRLFIICTLYYCLQRDFNVIYGGGDNVMRGQ